MKDLKIKELELKYERQMIVSRQSTITSEQDQQIEGSTYTRRVEQKRGLLDWFRPKRRDNTIIYPVQAVLLDEDYRIQGHMYAL